MKLLSILLSLTFVCLQPSGSLSSQAENVQNVQEEFALKIKRLAEMFADDNPSANKLADVLKGSTATKNSRHWVINGDQYKAVVTIYKSGPNPFASELTIYPESSMGIRFKHLETVLGKWKEIHQSLTSSVRFDFGVRQPSTGATIFVEMSFPPKDSESPILRINIRHKGA